MSDQTTATVVDISEERPIQPWTSTDPLPSYETRVYVMSIKAENGYMQYYFKDRPDSPDPTGDGPLTIRVPQDCTIVIKLDDAWKWEFRHENAIIIGTSEYPDPARYFNLVQDIVDGRCMQVQFNAQYLDQDVVNDDPYLFYINLDQIMPDGTAAPTLAVRIDPDIRNPGDHPPIKPN